METGILWYLTKSFAMASGVRYMSSTEMMRRQAFAAAAAAFDYQKSQHRRPSPFLRRRSRFVPPALCFSTVMFTLRRLPRYAPRLVSVRGNATLDATSTSQAQASTPPPPPVTAKPPPTETTPEALGDEAQTEAAAEEPKGKQRARPTRRPHISLERPREWCRPIAKGVEPAYDYALRYILRDAAFLRKELDELRAQVLAEEGKPDGARDEAALERMRERLGILEIQAEANLPAVRWKARNGMGECCFLVLWRRAGLER